MSEVISQFGGGILECTVYGVSMPHVDGRAGMAALTLADYDMSRFDFKALYKVCMDTLGYLI